VKPLTCIIGIRCIDGVVLAGDQRVLRGTEYSNEKKIIQAFPGFVLGASGLVGLMDKFLYQMREWQKSDEATKIPYSWWQFLNVLEDITTTLFARYGQRLGAEEEIQVGAFDFDVLCGCKEFKDKATIYHLYRNGFAQEVKTFDIIGHGTPHALPFIKTLYNQKRKMQDMAKVAAFTLKLIDEEKIDLTVGGSSQVYLIPDIGDYGSEKELTEQETSNLLNNVSPSDVLAGLFKLLV